MESRTARLELSDARGLGFSLLGGNEAPQAFRCASAGPGAGDVFFHAGLTYK